MNSPSKFVVGSANGFSLRLSQNEIIGYYPKNPRFLRIRVNDRIDIVLDDRFVDIQDPDFMSILPTQFGMGQIQHFASYQIRCVDIPFYACGHKFKFDGREVLVVFSNRPEDADEIEKAKMLAIKFLTERAQTDA